MQPDLNDTQNNGGSFKKTRVFANSVPELIQKLSNMSSQLESNSSMDIQQAQLYQQNQPTQLYQQAQSTKLYQQAQPTQLENKCQYNDNINRCGGIGNPSCKYVKKINDIYNLNLKIEPVNEYNETNQLNSTNEYLNRTNQFDTEMYQKPKSCKSCNSYK